MRSFRQGCYLVVGVVMCAPALSLPGRAEPSDGARSGFEQLVLSLRLSKQIYLVGEPIPMWAELRNPLSHPVEAHEGFVWYRKGGAQYASWGEDFLPLLCSHNDDPPKQYLPLRFYVGRSAKQPRRKDLAPAETRTAREILVFFGPELESLGKPGTLRVQVSFRQFPGAPSAPLSFSSTPDAGTVSASPPFPTITSSAVTVRIEEPTGKEVQAWARLRKDSRHYLLGYLYHFSPAFTPRNLEIRDALLANRTAPNAWRQRKFYDVTDIAALEGFLRDFPDSVYAPHAWFALGQMYPKAGQPEKAIEAFKRAVAHKHGGGIAEDAAFRVAEMLYEVPGDKRFESLPWYEKVVKQWPHGAWFDDASAKVDKMTRDSANVPFPNDRRLDKRIAYRFERETPYPEVFREISILGGVPLRVDASVQWKMFAGSAKAQSIREFMLGTKGTDVLWVSEPDGGYRLVPRAIPDVPAMK